MHSTAYKTSKLFFDTYCNRGEISVVDIGSLDLNGSMRDNITSNVKTYIGVDFAAGKGVDIVLSDPYQYPFSDKTFDVVVSNSCFEHSELFWLSFLEGMRILKEDGIMYVNAPSSWMMYHRHPVDCWRFYPDAAKALETWARRNGMNSMVLESYVSSPGPEIVADYVFVMLKNAEYADKYPSRMIDKLEPANQFFNGFRFPVNDKYPHGWDMPICPRRQDWLMYNADKTSFYLPE